MQGSALISVVIPVYNLEKYIAQTLESVIAAKKQYNLEVICVDDGSFDATGKILDEYAAKYDWIRVVHQENKGAGGARNTGVRLVKGEWVTFLDGDDLWCPNYLDEVVRIVKVHPDLDIIGFSIQRFVDDLSAILPEKENIEERIYNVETCISPAVANNLRLIPAFFKSNLVERFSFTNLLVGEDILFAIKCLSAAKKIAMVENGLYAYRNRKGSVSNLPWNLRKIVGLMNYQLEAMRAIAASDKKFAAGVTDIYASVWLSECPARIARLRGGELAQAGSAWVQSLVDFNLNCLSFKYRVVRSCLLLFKGHRRTCLRVAKLFRALNIS